VAWVEAASGATSRAPGRGMAARRGAVERETRGKESQGTAGARRGGCAGSVVRLPGGSVGGRRGTPACGARRAVSGGSGGRLCREEARAA
jgi:hypothetical protein